MRIGVNCFPLKPDTGGMKQQFVVLFDHLLANDRGNEYVFFCFPHNRGELQNLRSDVWRENAVELSGQDDIRQYLRDLDLYFCPFGALWPRPVPVPSVVMLPDVQEQAFPHFFSPEELLSRAYHFRGSTVAADAVITVSEFSKAAISRFHRISPEKISVCHLCPDPGFLDSVPADDRRPGSNGAAPYMLYPANPWPHKNHACLLQAVRLLKDEGLDIRLVLTGFEIEREGRLANLAKELGIEDWVQMLGYVSLPDLVRLYREARLLVFPSLYEGFGMPPLEAMAAGCPAVVSNSASLPEVCGDAAHYCDPQSAEDIARAVRLVWESETLRSDLKTRGRERAARFSPARMAELHLQAFQQARDRYSLLRYRWQRHIYQPFHRYRVHAADWAEKRRGAPVGGECRIFFTSGWHPRESNGSESVRWMSGRGRLIVKAAEEIDLEIRAEAASLADSNGVNVILNGTSLARWPLAPGGFAFEPIPSVILKLHAGRNVIDLVSWRRGISTKSDPRVLAVAFRNLSFLDSSRRIGCKFG